MNSHPVEILLHAVTRFSHVRLAILVVLCAAFGASAARAQTTYTWAGGGSASWAAAASWTPARTTPQATDILVFNGGGAVTATSVPAQTIGQLLVSGATLVTLNSGASGNTLTIAGGTGTDLSVASGCALNVAGGTTLSLLLAAGATAASNGATTFTGAAHTLNAVDAGAVVFGTGSIFTQGTGATGNAFTAAGTPGAVIFASGSTFVSQAGSNPFGLGQPASKVVFQTGSLFRHMQSATPSFSGRTYANFELNFGAVITTTGAAGVSIDDLTVTQGTLNVNMTGPTSIKGNVSVPLGGTLGFSPASAATLAFAGGSPQTVTAGGPLTFGANQLVSVTNPTSVKFNSPVTFSNAVTVAAGATLATAATLTSNGATAVNGTLQLDAGGWATGLNDFVYGAGASLVFNNTVSYGVNNDPPRYWPAASGPTNVTVLQGGLTLNVARTVAGTFKTAATVTNGQNLMLLGTCRLETGGTFGADTTKAPVFGGTGTLEYNLAGTPSVGIEWKVPSLAANPAGKGQPFNVSVLAGTLQMPAASRACDGSLSIGTGATLRLNASLGSRGTTTIASGGTLDLNNRGFGFSGSALVNNGAISGPLSSGPNNALSITSTTSTNQTYSGTGSTGTSADPLVRLGISKVGGDFTIDPASTIHVAYANFFRGGTLTNADRLVIGSNGAIPASLQFGNGIPGGTFPGIVLDHTPTYALGAGSLGIGYNYETTPRTTGAEIPAGRTIGDLYIANLSGVTLAGGDLTVSSLTIDDGVLAVGPGQRLRLAAGGTISQSATGAIAGGAAGGTVEALGGCTVSGTLTFNDFQMDAGGVDFGTGSTIGHLLLLNGGNVAGGHPPTYADGSTLRYNVPGGYGVYDEWTPGAAGPGVPYHVEIAQGTVDFNPNASSTPRTARGSLSILPGAGLTLGNTIGGDLFLHGDWTDQGTFTHNDRAVIFDGTLTQSVQGSATFAYLQLSNPAGLLLSSDLTAQNQLTMAGGNISTQGNKVVMAPGATLSRTSGWVVGHLQKQLPISGGAGSQTFEVGDNSVYSPVDVSTTSGAGSFDVVASTTPGDHPDLAASGLDPAKSVNRFWTLTSPNGAGQFANYDATFHYAAGDADGGADPNQFMVRKRDGATWTAPGVGTRSPTSTQATGMTSFSDFAVGEPAMVPTTTSLGSVANPSVYGESVTLTATVSPAAAGGLVEFFDGAASLGTATLSGGTAVLSTSALTVGSHTLSAVYAGGASFGGSTSPAVSHEVLAKLTASAGPNGTISPLGDVLVSAGGSATFTFAANSGYHVDAVVVDGSNLGVQPSPYAFTNVTTNHTIDVQFAVNPPVAAVTTLAAAQVKSGNDTDGTTKIALSWAATPAGTTVELWRAPFGSYPEYDDLGGAAPAAPASYPPAGVWSLAGSAAGPSGAFVDEPGARDFWYYVGYVVDGYATMSAVSNRTNGTLDYHLGDVTDGVTVGAGDNSVGIGDLSALGAHYGLSGPAVDPWNFLDVGPTTDYSVDTRPSTDNALNFEDLMMFALNFSVVSSPMATLQSVAEGLTRVSLEVPADVAGSITTHLWIEGAGDVHGLSTRLTWDPAVVEPVSFAPGDLLAAQRGVAMSAAPGSVDAAVLQSGGLAGEGLLANVTFRRIGAGDPKFAIASIDARDAANRKVTIELGERRPVAPAVTSLRGSAPNPFRGSTTLAFGLSTGGPVDLTLYSVDGRRIRTLVRDSRDPGEYRVTWDGRDERGQRAAAGVYYARLVTAQGTFVRATVRVE